MTDFRIVAEVFETAASSCGITFKIKLKDRVGGEVNFHAAVNAANPTAKRVGWAQVAKLAKACNKEYIEDTDELKGIEFILTLNATSDIVKMEPIKEFVRVEIPAIVDDADLAAAYRAVKKAKKKLEKALGK